MSGHVDDCDALAFGIEPPPFNDADPAVRHALCELLDRLGGDGTCAWLNGYSVRSVQDEIYAHVTDMRRREAAR